MSDQLITTRRRLQNRGQRQGRRGEREGRNSLRDTGLVRNSCQAYTFTHTQAHATQTLRYAAHSPYTQTYNTVQKHRTHPGTPYFNPQGTDYTHKYTQAHIYTYAEHFLPRCTTHPHATPSNNTETHPYRMGI